MLYGYRDLHPDEEGSEEFDFTDEDEMLESNADLEDKFEWLLTR